MTTQPVVACPTADANLHLMHYLLWLVSCPKIGQLNTAALAAIQYPAQAQREWHKCDFAGAQCTFHPAACVNPQAQQQTCQCDKFMKVQVVVIAGYERLGLGWAGERRGNAGVWQERGGTCIR